MQHLLSAVKHVLKGTKEDGEIPCRLHRGAARGLGPSCLPLSMLASVPIQADEYCIIDVLSSDVNHSEP